MSGHVLRRSATITFVLVALPLLVVGAPLWLPMAVLVDGAQRLFRFPTVRLGLMLVVYLAHQWVCLALAGALAIRRWLHLEPRHQDPSQALVPYRRVQGWWVASLVVWARRLLGVRFDGPDPALLPQRGFIVLSRHASMIDAALPLYLVTRRPERFVHYVLKRELRFDPTLDLYARQLDNHFVTRTGDGVIEAAAINQMAFRARPHSALVIFPEGTYASPRRRARVRRSLQQRGETELVALADDLDHLLPPKPAGALAMLTGQPGFDVVVLGHVGLEGVSDLAGLRRRLPLTRSVTVQWWHHPRAEVPPDEQEAIDWLNDRWRTLDRWVQDVMGQRHDPEPARGRASGPRRQGETP